MLPKRAILLLFVSVMIWIGCILYSIQLNPEVNHYVQGATIKQKWTDQLTREHKMKLVIFGGSSCEFSIDGERMLQQHQLPLVNFGGHAGMGACILTAQALDQVNPGDTLIVALEPGLLTKPLTQSSLGVQYSVAAGHTDWVTQPRLEINPLNKFQVAVLLRPGGYQLFTMLGKLIRREPLYRYQLADYHPSGWKHTTVRVPVTGIAGHNTRLSDDSIRLLNNLKTWCDKQQVRIVYSLPWSYCPTNEIKNFQRQNAQFLAQVAAIIPVLKDPMLGADPIAEHYADSSLHLTEAAVPIRTDQLASQIKSWQLWTVAELETLANAEQ